MYVCNIQVLMDCAHNLIKRSKRASALSEFFQNCLNVVVLMSIFLGDIWGKMLIYSVLLTFERHTHRNIPHQITPCLLFASSQRAAAFNDIARERAPPRESELQDKKKTINENSLLKMQIGRNSALMCKWCTLQAAILKDSMHWYDYNAHCWMLLYALKLTRVLVEKINVGSESARVQHRS